jgi:hypothetical protein
MSFFMFGLIVSGLTAFPLQLQMDFAASVLNLDLQNPAANGPVGSWLATLTIGLREMYARHPWIAYGTDWLAFSHLAIAVFFVGPLIDPVRNVWVVKAGLICCAGVIPLALICGPLRGIPLFHQFIDISFGVLGAIPLLYCLKLTPKIESSGK